MPWTSVAIGVGSKIVGGLFGGKSKAKAAKKASKAQQAAALRQEALAREFDARTQKQTEPYRQFGESSTSKLSDYLGMDTVSNDYKSADSDYNSAKTTFDSLSSQPKLNKRKQQVILDAKIASAKTRLDASKLKLDGTTKNNARSDSFGSLLKPFSQDDLNKDVVYNNGLKFGLDQGTQALNNRSLATGNFDSGAALKELTRYANDYGETKAGGAQQRFMGDKGFTYDALSGGIHTGQNAVGQSASTMGAALGARTEAIGGGANAKSAGFIRQGENSANMYGQFADAIGGINFGDLFKRRNYGDIGGNVTKDFSYGGKTFDKFSV